jgi:putative transposase
MKGLGVRIARGVNKLLGRKGRVIADRFYVEVLRSPRQVAHALDYVLGNYFRHLGRLPNPVLGTWAGFTDVCASPAHEGLAPPARSRPRTWKLARAEAELRYRSVHIADPRWVPAGVELGT